ncbi:MAG: ABC transporter ATP-binding protein [Desulfobacteraceae bacterium]|nr:ABC transporter ATP-binding protein [Desulfobacteraceae bacterium]
MDKKRAFEVKNLFFYYGKTQILNDLSLNIDSGKFYGIVGPNGCGKTTLLDLLIKNKRPASGAIRYLGHNIKRYQRRTLAKEIALVPQDFYINFPFTVKEIVMMGRHPHISRFASPSVEDISIRDEIMERMEIDEFKEKYVTELSGGEKQRVVIARALVQDTPVLILDEGTSNMDIQHTLRTLEMAAESVKLKKRTVVAALHNLNLAAAFCDHIVFMKDGTIVSEGEIDNTLNEQNIKDVFEVDSKVYFDRYSNSKQVVYKR